GAVVPRGYADGGDLGHVGPAELGPRRPADRRDELGRGRMAEAGPGAVGHVEDRHRPRGKQGPNDLGGLLSRPVRREPEVDGYDALVRDHVPGDAAPDPDRVEALAVAQ